MINAHCEQSYKVWAEDEKKLYNFRILELSGKFISEANVTSYYI